MLKGFRVISVLQLDITFGYILEEAHDNNIRKAPKIMKRINEINEVQDTNKQFVYSLLDVFLAKLQTILKCKKVSICQPFSI